MIDGDDFAAISGMNGGRNRNIRKKPAPVPLCKP
jgi:hypothetical protein